MRFVTRGHHPRRDDMSQATASQVTYAPGTTTQVLPSSARFATDYDAVVATVGHYIEGGRAGDSSLMRPYFLPDATIVGYAGETLLSGAIEQLYAWIDANGPAPDVECRFAAVEIHESIAVVHLEAERWTVAGSEVRFSDAFTLVKTDDGWRIAHKIFHWHVN
jgi:hypothetical protein